MNDLQLSGNTTTTSSGDTKVFQYERHQARQPKIIPKPKFLTAQANRGFSEVAEGMSKQKYIFGGLISEGDMTLLFSQANIGKSFMSWQIGQAKASGKNVFSIMDYADGQHHGQTKYYNLNNTSAAEKVLIFDFESTRQKNKGRYTNNGIEYPFNENLLISYPDYGGAESDFSNAEAIITAIGQKIKETHAKLVIIDNITSLSEDNADGKKALLLMKRLKWLQIQHNITLLVIAHTTKIIAGQPVIWQNMAGSYIMFSLADNVFAINNSTDDKGNYLIQLKAKYSEKHFENDNVIAMRKTTRPDGLTGFEFIDYARETALLKPVDEDRNLQEKLEVIRILTASKAMDTEVISLREVAKELHEKYGKDVSFLTYYNRLKQRKKRGDYDQEVGVNDTDIPAPRLTHTTLKTELKAPETVKSTVTTLHTDSPLIKKLKAEQIRHEQEDLNNLNLNTTAQ